MTASLHGNRLPSEFARRNGEMLGEETRERAVRSKAEFVGKFDQWTIEAAQPARRDPHSEMIDIVLRGSSHTAPELLEESRTGQSHQLCDVIDPGILERVLVNEVERLSNPVIDRTIARR